jgi:hypothetical protein
MRALVKSVWGVVAGVGSVVAEAADIVVVVGAAGIVAVVVGGSIAGEGVVVVVERVACFAGHRLGVVGDKATARSLEIEVCLA